MSSSSPQGKAKEKRQLDPERVETWMELALAYLNRYDASVGKLEQVLKRRALKEAWPLNQATLAAMQLTLERLQESQLVSDQRYAERLLSGFRQRGLSALKIQQKMRARGLTESTVSSSLKSEQAETPGQELQSALTWARKRGLTRRYELGTREGRAKAQAALARQGYSYSVAASVLLALSRDELAEAGGEGELGESEPEETSGPW